MLDKSFYQGAQGECFIQLETHWRKIKHEFDSQKDKTFLYPEDFSDSNRGSYGDYVHGEWRALGIQSGSYEGQTFNDYPILYSILRKFPYKTNVAIMTVGPKTRIGNHRDSEGGWRYQLCLDDGGGDQSGMHIMNLETKNQELHVWRSGQAIVFQPSIQLHNGFNNNPGERTTLLIDFYKESLYTEDKFKQYYQHYSECFEGLDQFVEVYESRKNKNNSNNWTH